MADADAERRGFGEQRAVGRGVGIDRDPELARAEVAQHGGHAAHVVGVGVGERDDVETPDLARPEIGRDDLFADVEGCAAGRILGVGSSAGGAAGVDQHGAARGADDQQRVSLADVDGGDFELAGMDGGRLRPEDDGGGEWKNGERGSTRRRASGARPSSRGRSRQWRAVRGRAQGRGRAGRRRVHG